MIRVYHQEVRYQIAKKVIDFHREKENHSILEVGSGWHGNIFEFLPNDSITCLDLNIPDDKIVENKIVRGDVLNLKFNDNSIDFVVALDMLEHLKKEDRLTAIKNMLRVSRNGIFLTFPHEEVSASYCDETLGLYYTILGKEKPIWIDEHVDCQLPNTNEIVELLTQLQINESNYYMFYGVNSQLSALMLFWETLASKYQSANDFFQILNKSYINDVMTCDISDNIINTQKTYLYIAKNTKIKKLFRSEENKDKLISFYNEMYSRSLKTITSLFLKKTFDFDNRMNKIIDIGNGQENVNDIFISKLNQVLQTEQNILQGENEVLIKYKEIISKGDEMAKKISKLTDKPIENKLNVVLITYNHSNYIEESLNSILMQKTNFTFNIIVADDCSTDNTVSYIKRIEKKTDIKFVYLDNSTNVGTMKNYQKAFASCDAKYIAIMEGDDIWLDDHKLQKMVDFLDNHLGYSMVFNRYFVQNFEKGIKYEQPKISLEQEQMSYLRFTGHDLAYDNFIGNFSTCCYRKENIINIPAEVYSMKCYDWFYNILMSRFGYIGCLPDIMSTYRIHDKGLWSGLDEDKKLKDLISNIDMYNEYTNKEFQGGFMAHKARLERLQKVPEVIKQKTPAIKVVYHGFVKLILGLCPRIVIVIIKLILPPFILHKLGIQDKKN